MEFNYIFVILASLVCPSVVVQAQDDPAACPATERMQLFCFFGTWYENSAFNSVKAANIDPYMCTHVILAYVWCDLDRDTNKWRFKFDEEVVRSVVRSRSSKKRGTQYLISLGGYNDYEYGIQKEKYTQIAQNPEARDSFLKSVLTFLLEHDLDGLDFFWNWIGRGEGIIDNLRELSGIALHMCGHLKQNGFFCSITLRLLLHQDDDFKQDLAYTYIRQIVRSADVVHIWTADIVTPGNFYLDDLFLPDGNSSHPYYKSSVNYIVDYYKEALGDNLELFRKLSMVIPLQWNAQAIPKGEQPVLGMTLAGNHPMSDGLQWQYPFCLICSRLQKQGPTSESFEFKLLPNEIPIAHSYNFRSKGVGLAVSTITPEFAKIKVEFAREQNFGSVSVFQIGADDVHGWCYNNSYPILSAINEALDDCRFF